MARGIEVKVTANTRAAHKSLQELDAEVQKMQQKAAARNKQTAQDSSGGGLLGGLSGKGADALNEGLGKIPVVGNLAQKALGGLRGSVSGLGAVLAAGVTLVAKLAGGLADWVKIGQKASDEASKINVSLSALSKNLGSTASTEGLTQSIQWLAAEGVGNIEHLTAAARTLMVAFEGNQGVVKSLLPIFDDVAAATSLTADQLAQMTARVQASGKIETEVLNMLRDRGIPVYKLLGETMGVTGEEAQALAKKGKAGLSEWLDLVQSMHESYKGLSAELSTNTLEGAKATYEAARSLAFKGAADAASAQEMARLNAKSAQFKIDAFDMELQTELRAAGEIVGKVQGMYNDVKELLDDKWALASRALAGLMGAFSDTGEAIGRELVAAAADFRQVPHFAGMSSKQIGEYLAAAQDLYKKMEGSLNAGMDMEEDTAAQFKASMERLKKNLEIAETASAEALKAEAKAAAEKKAAAEAAAEAKIKADKEAAAKAEKERIEREKNEAAIKKERLERLKLVEDYATTVKKNAAREQADKAVEAGDVDAMEKAADAMAQAAGALSLTDAELTLEQLAEKLRTNPEEMTREEVETHRELTALLEEVQKLNEAAAAQAEENQKAAEEEAAQKEQERRENVAAVEEDANRQQETARKKAEAQQEAMDPADIADAAAQYQQELVDSGLSLREARELFNKWVENQLADAQKDLINGLNYTDEDGHATRVVADPQNLKTMRELVKATHSGTLEERKAAREQVNTMQEANKLARQQIRILGKLKFEAKAL